MNLSVRVAKDIKIHLHHFDGMNYTKLMNKIVSLLISLKI
jgi:hypothetical protein